MAAKYHMTKIVDGLYLGDLDDAKQTSQLQQFGITHILTIDEKPLHSDWSKYFEYKCVIVYDLVVTDLLSHFLSCYDFIEDGRRKGGVLVHCLMGMSRSATMVLAYIMMKEGISLKEALQKVKEKRPQIRPNEGFMYQLHLLDDMGSQFDKNNDNYKLYRLNLLGDRIKNHCIDDNDGATSCECLGLDPQTSSDQQETVYKCRKCRRALFTESSLMSHFTGSGEAAFDWRRNLKKQIEEAAHTPNLDKCDQSLFIEPVQWMEGSIMVMEGKLSCPKCNSKLGSFTWKGERCSCGSWVTPAFHVTTGKVDKCPPMVIKSPPQTKVASDLPIMNTSSFESNPVQQ